MIIFERKYFFILSLFLLIFYILQHLFIHPLYDVDIEPQSDFMGERTNDMVIGGAVTVFAKPVSTKFEVRKEKYTIYFDRHLRDYSGLTLYAK